MAKFSILLALCFIALAAASTKTTPTTRWTRTKGMNTTPTTRWTYPTITTRRIATTPKHSAYTSYYYMDSSINCYPYSTDKEFFYSRRNVAYVKAWGSSYYKQPRSSCSYTFNSYGIDDLEYRFTNLAINDCNVQVNIYHSSFTSGTPKRTYTCLTSPSYYSTYNTANTGIVTIELVNTGLSSNFDFTFHVRDIDYNPMPVGEIVGLSVGLSVGVIVVFASLVACRRARRRRVLRRGGLLIASAESTIPSGYPVGQAPYTQSYGAVTTNVYTHPPPAGSYPAAAPQPPTYNAATPYPPPSYNGKT